MSKTSDFLAIVLRPPTGTTRFSSAFASSLLPLLLLFILSAAAQPADFNYAASDGQITITGYAGVGDAVTIPGTINGLPVTRIGDFAFANSTNLTSVTIPNTVTRIGASAFQDCASLASVTIPNSVNTIWPWAFSGCARLTSVTIPNSVTSIGHYAFYSCASLTNVAIPGSVTSIQDSTFEYCASLTSISIPNSVTAIWPWAFHGCASLTRVTLPNSLANMGEYAFYGCASLANIAIPNSVTRIEYSTFERCASLTNVTIGNGVTDIEDSAFKHCASLASFSIPQSVTWISYSVFYGCASLRAITVDALNSAYSSVDGVLFNKDRTELIQYPGGQPGSYTIPNSVISIGEEAFASSALTGVTIPDSVKYIGSGVGGAAFEYCASLTNITIPNSVAFIARSTFQNCARLNSVTIPHSVASIGEYAFAGCASLTNIVIHNTLTNIDRFAFSDCSNLRAITVDALNPAYSSVDGVLFNKSQSRLIQYPGGKAGSYVIPNGVAAFEEGALRDCAKLTSVTIPSSVTSISYYPFDGCPNLSSITVDGLNSDYSSADGVLFNKDRTNLIKYPEGKAGSYTLPSSVTRIDQYAFNRCASLSAITVDASNTVYSSVDGILFNKMQTLLFQYPGGKAGSYTIPNSVTNVAEHAFAGSAGLATVTIPSSVTDIGWLAFYGCASLTGVYFKSNAPYYDDFFSPDYSLLTGSDKATLYYLPKTTGWGPPFGGHTAVLWNPQTPTSDAAFGVRANQFGFPIKWGSDGVVVVEACADLANPVWIPVGTQTIAGGSSYFSDPDWANHTTRVYRLRSP